MGKALIRQLSPEKVLANASVNLYNDDGGEGRQSAALSKEERLP